jgi:hypothetical protein
MHASTRHHQVNWLQLQPLRHLLATLACGNCLRQVEPAAAIEKRNSAQASTHDAAPISNNSHCRGGIIVSV